MAAPKGVSYEGAGRPKDSSNKVTIAARELFVVTLEKESKYIEAAFAKVRDSDPGKYLEIFAKYAQYFVPKKIDLNTDMNIINVIAPDKRNK
ncbi:MAG: hypothetical protein ABI241_00595 [Bacteroidia bacterium]